MNLSLVKDRLAPGNINLGSEAWFRWVGRVKSFRYCPNSDGYYYLRADITVRNRTRDYWYAYRTVDTKQRTFYLGKSAELDFERLQLAVDELSLSPMDYYKLVCDRKLTVQEKRKYTSAPAVKNLYTPSQTFELIQLEVEQLKEKLAAAEEIVQLAKEVVASMVKKNMTSGPSLANLRDRLNG